MAFTRVPPIISSSRKNSTFIALRESHRHERAQLPQQASNLVCGAYVPQCGNPLHHVPPAASTCNRWHRHEVRVKNRCGPATPDSDIGDSPCLDFVRIE